MHPDPIHLPKPHICPLSLQQQYLKKPQNLREKGKTNQPNKQSKQQQQQKVKQGEGSPPESCGWLAESHISALRTFALLVDVHCHES